MTGPPSQKAGRIWKWGPKGARTPSLCWAGWSGPRPHSPGSGTRRRRMCTALGGPPAQPSGPARTPWTSASRWGAARCPCVLAVAKPICLRNSQLREAHACFCIETTAGATVLLYLRISEWRKQTRIFTFQKTTKEINTGETKCGCVHVLVCRDESSHEIKFQRYEVTVLLLENNKTKQLNRYTWDKTWHNKYQD